MEKRKKFRSSKGYERKCPGILGINDLAVQSSSAQKIIDKKEKKKRPSKQEKKKYLLGEGPAISSLVYCSLSENKICIYMVNIDIFNIITDSNRSGQVNKLTGLTLSQPGLLVGHCCLILQAGQTS